MRDFNVETKRRSYITRRLRYKNKHDIELLNYLIC